ncbi:MAG TPA: FAD binding domain-containing protein [Pseudolabrys sp.]|nr:FAD binding domain-containing protein [Pseudolabrys sp.]
MAAKTAGRALIIGGSLSGLFTGLLLRRRGWEVDIYERVGNELAGRGAGIVTHQPLWDALDELGIEWRENLGVAVETRRIFGLDGKLVLEHACPQILTAWDRMYDLLRQVYPSERYHRGKELTQIAQDADSVTANFADGTRASADLLIGCDGLRSSVRNIVLPEVRPQYAGYVAWRGLVPESAFSPDLHEQIFMHLAFCLPKGEQMLGYPVAGPNNDLRPGHRRYNLVWYRPADDEALNSLLTDDHGTRYDVSIPPPTVSRASIAGMRDAAERVLAPQFRECWRLSEQPFLQAIYDVLSPKLAFGRVTIVGDASYVARPHCGAGVTKAADDAMVLCNALAAKPTVEEALRDYEANRVPFCGRVVAHARRLGSYLQAQLKSEDERRAAERHFSAEAVLRETATLDFLAEAG